LALWLLQLAAVGPSLFPSEVQEVGIPGAGMLWIPATALIGIYVWSTYWLKVSRQAFRYTCSVGGFRAAKAADTADPCCLTEPKMGWLAYDLAQRLNRRVPRLFFSEIGVTEYPEELKGAPSINERHIHIDGSYVVRPQADEESSTVTLEQDLRRRRKWEVVIMPRVCMGPTEHHGRLGYLVTYPIERPLDDGSPPGLTPQDYEQLAERVYHSVATEIYHQIERDVHDKIELLPTAYHRAVALYHEAEDYARSNTLQAYRVASRLYRKAALTLYPFDPLLKSAPHSLPRRISRACRASLAGLDRAIRRAFGWIPRVADREVLLARTRIGYANMILFEHRLAHLSGRAEVPAYRARPIAQQALTDLRKLPKDVDQRDDALFDAHVSLGYAYACLGDYVRASKTLDEAKALNPRKTTRSATYLLARSRAIRYFQKSLSQVQSEVCEAKLDRLIPATELSPRFEVAVFKKAFATEMLWRSGSDPLNSNQESETVLDAYERVLTLNPGNIGAAANAAYVAWLCNDLPKAERFLKRACDYKLMNPETVIVELNHGLARIYAERGQFEDAFKHFQLARKGVLAHDSTHHLTNKVYFYIGIDRDLLDRYERFKETVFREADILESKKKTDSGYTGPGQDVLDAVRAFVANDCAEAHENYHRRAADPSIRKRERKRALSLFKMSADLYQTYEAPLLALAELSVNEDLVASAGCFEKLGRIAAHSRFVALARARYLGRVVEHLLEKEEKIEKKTKAYEELERSVRRTQQEAGKLLPHTWLWKDGRKLEQRTFENFEWATLERRQLRDEARWEKEFDNVHVEALKAWIAPELAILHKNPHVLRTRRDREKTRKLFRLIYDVFGEKQVDEICNVQARSKRRTNPFRLIKGKSYRFNAMGEWSVWPKSTSRTDEDLSGLKVFRRLKRRHEEGPYSLIGEMDKKDGSRPIDIGELIASERPYKAQKTGDLYCVADSAGLMRWLNTGSIDVELIEEATDYRASG
jgi:tetratricopeptide (TPR) repeat protein